jgi:hypothetical protein
MAGAAGVWREIGALARLAPTPHNTQPFRIRPRGDDAADLLLFSERLLPEEDHGNRYVLSAFGLFTAALERAARHVGRAIDITPVPDVDPAKLSRASGTVLLGEVRITGQRAKEPQDALLDARRTSRLPYHDRDVAPDALARFAEIAEAGGHRMKIVSDKAVVASTLRLNAAAIVDNLQLHAERREIEGWYRYGPTPEYGDGLWQVPMNQPAWELRTAFGAPSLFKLPGLNDFAVHRYLKTQAGTRHVALLSGPFERLPDLYGAGRMLLDLWIEMARQKVYMQPFGSMLTNPVYAKKVAARFGVDDCWLIMRLGYSDPPPRAPRLKDIVVDA